MPTGIDIDNTLAATDVQALYRLNRQFERRYKRAALTAFLIEDCREIPPNERDFVHGLFESEEFYRSIPALKHAAVGVETIADSDDVYYITNRDKRFADVTVEWLSEHGFPVGELLFIRGSKVGVCEQCRIEAFIDDSAAQAIAVAEACKIPVYMIRQYWNRHVKHPGITVVDNWVQIIDIINGEFEVDA